MIKDKLHATNIAIGQEWNNPHDSFKDICVILDKRTSYAGQ